MFGFVTCVDNASGKLKNVATSRLFLHVASAQVPAIYCEQVLEFVLGNERVI